MVAASEVLTFLADGIVFGSILGLSAVGLSLVYGILKLSNFAHGDLLTLGALLTLLFGVLAVAHLGLFAGALAGLLLLALAADHVWTRRLGRAELSTLAVFAGALGAAAGYVALARPGPGTTLPVLVAATLVALALTVAFTIGLEFALWRPLRRRGATLLTLLIVSIGLSLVVRNSLQLAFGGGLRSFDRPVPVSDRILGARISDAQQFTLVACAVLVVALHLLLTRTRIGKAMRAVADDADLARSCGVDVDRVVVHVWAITGALVAVSGVLLTLVQNNTMNVNMGLGLLLPLFAAVIVGGIGSPYGAIAGGLIVGVAMKTSALWLGTKYELASAFLILIGTLVLRPQGVFGGRG